jgi:hypothetical protein
MPTLEEFQKFVKKSIDDKSVSDAAKKDYESVAARIDENGGDYNFDVAETIREIFLNIDKKNFGFANHLKETFANNETGGKYLIAIESFERYVAQQQAQQKTQDIKDFMSDPNAKTAKSMADDLVQKLKTKTTDNKSSTLGFLFRTHQAKLDNKSITLEHIIKKVEDLGYTDPKTYKERFVNILSDYLKINKTNKEGPILGSDTKAKLEGIVSKLNPAPAPTANKVKPG